MTCHCFVFFINQSIHPIHFSPYANTKMSSVIKLSERQGKLDQWLLRKGMFDADLKTRALQFAQSTSPR